jgi:hypothetical protein
MSGRVCRLQLLLVLASVVSLGSESHCLTFETFPTWRVKCPYLYPPGTGGPVITLVVVFPLVASYASQVGVFETASTPGWLSTVSRRSVRLLLTFASTVMAGFSLLKICTCFEMGLPLRRRRGRCFYVGWLSTCLVTLYYVDKDGIENTASKNSSIVICLFAAAEMFLYQATTVLFSQYITISKRLHIVISQMTMLFGVTLKH